MIRLGGIVEGDLVDVLLVVVLCLVAWWGNCVHGGIDCSLWGLWVDVDVGCN